MREVEITIGRLLRVYWLFLWRAIIGGLVIGAVFGFVIGFIISAPPVRRRRLPSSPRLRG